MSTRTEPAPAVDVDAAAQAADDIAAMNAAIDAAQPMTTARQVAARYEKTIVGRPIAYFAVFQANGQAWPQVQQGERSLPTNVDPSALEDLTARLMDVFGRERPTRIVVTATAGGRGHVAVRERWPVGDGYITV
jgi:2-hydroxychromene-2-carboxylate isomerase